jgi:hypothetical protein
MSSSRVGKPPTETEGDTVFDANALEGTDGLEKARQAAVPTTLLLRLPQGLKTALTVEAAKRTMAVGSRISVNTLIVHLLEDALVELALGKPQAA